MSEYSPVSAEAAALSLLLERQSRSKVRRLCDEHGGPLQALSARRGGQSGRLRNGVTRLALSRRQAQCANGQMGLICQHDPAFPSLLKCIPDAPLALYYRGEIEVLERPAVAVVGARRASRFGLDLAMALGRGLAGIGVTVVSGLALGIDGAAHRGALEGQGATVAVLGSGLDRVQPISHQPLAGRILARGGLLVSEYPPNRPATAYQFPERNRLISGLCAGVVVVEASARSGSLITARLAAEQGREVMAVPGAPGLPNSSGANRLLKSGAALIESVDDVLAELGLSTDPIAPRENGAGFRGIALSEELVAVLDQMDSQASDTETLALALGLSIQECAVRLTELELGGFVQRVADGYIRRPSEF